METRFTVIRPDYRRSDFDDTFVIEQAELDAANAQLALVPARSREELLDSLHEADGFLAAGLVTREMIEAMPKCRAIITVSHGFDKVDLAAATEAGIPVTNTFFCQEEVANHTLALLLAVTRKVVPLHNKLAQGVWAPELQPPVPPLNEQTLGLIGLGHIGREVARRARAFDLSIIAYDPHVDARTAVKHGVELVGLDAVFERADYVSAHAPLNDATFHIVNARTLALMKPTAYFFNTARGPLVDEPALIEALAGGRIAGAGLDVFEQEPTLPDNLLYGLPNVVLTPHAAGYSDRSISHGRQLAAAEMARMLNGRYPANLLNPEVRGATRAPYA